MSTQMIHDSRPYYTETHTIFVKPIRDPSPYARTFNIDKINRPMLKSGWSAFAYGLGAGLIGITAWVGMSITQTIDQLMTGRPAARVPGESILRLFRRNFSCKELFHRSGRRSPSPSLKSKGKAKEQELLSEEIEEGSEPSNLTEPPSEGGELVGANAAAKWAAHFGHGVVLGGFRGIMSYYGVRGFLSDIVFLGFTSSVDSRSFWTHTTDNVPLSQLLLESAPELIHQATYAFVTGFFCDHWVN